jgi:hypothetical protein
MIATMSNPTAYLLYPWILMTHEQRTKVMEDLINRGLAIDATKK